MSNPRVGILGFGEVGALLHDQLRSRGWNPCVFDIAFDNETSAAYSALTSRNSINATATAQEMAATSDVILSAVTAGNALDALDSIVGALPKSAYFVDLNSVSPASKRAMAKRCLDYGVRFVEASIMSPVSPLGLSSPILLAGSNAQSFLHIGNSFGFSDLTVAGTEYGKAAAIKMCRSVVIKGMEALITESMLAAKHYGVENEVLASLANLMPVENWPRYASYMITRSLKHGVRRSEEMREAAATLAEAGVEPLMTRSCVTRQELTAKEPGNPHASILELLDHLEQSSGEYKERNG